MNGLESLLSSRSSLILAALAVSWVAVVLLGLVVANLHYRLAHLEQGASNEEGHKPYGHLLGRELAPLLGEAALVPTAGKTLFALSERCRACDRVLAELRSSAPGDAVVLAWRDATPSPLPPLPPGVVVFADGPALCRDLGIGVTPFALTTDGVGRIVRAAPVGTLETLHGFLEALPAKTAREASPSFANQPLKGVS